MYENAKAGCGLDIPVKNPVVTIITSHELRNTHYEVDSAFSRRHKDRNSK